MLVSVFKSAILDIAKEQETRVSEWIEKKKKTYPSEDAYLSDRFALSGLNEITMLRKVCDDYCDTSGLSPADATMIFVMLHSAWNDTLDWAKLG